VYVPPDDVRGDLLAASYAPPTWCEFKGAARYLDAVVDGHRVHAVAWTYRHPTPAYEALRDHVAFYPGRVDVAWMGDERVQAQASDFYVRRAPDPPDACQRSGAAAGCVALPSGSRMKTSAARSGSMWFALMKAWTVRPVRASIAVMQSARMAS
jgi:hypothetical protein